MRVISFVNQSTVVVDAAFRQCVAALQVQLARDFAPLWGITAALAISRGKPVGEAIYILDDSTQADALGWHTEDNQGNPVGFVFARTAQQDGTSWTETASHELLEQLADPWACNAAVATWQGRPAAIAWENCDPVENDGYSVGGALLSNFVLPAWFTGGGNRWDFLGRLKAPLTMTKGGYVAFCRDLKNWQDSFGAHHKKTNSDYSRHHRRQHRCK